MEQKQGFTMPDFDKNTVNGRLGIFMLYKKMSYTALAKALDTNTSSLSTFYSTGSSYKGVFAIPNVFPELSLEWLWRGEGPMLKDDLKTNLHPSRVQYTNDGGRQEFLAEPQDMDVKESEDYKHKYLTLLESHTELVQSNSLIQGELNAYKTIVERFITKP